MRTRDEIIAKIKQVRASREESATDFIVNQCVLRSLTWALGREKDSDMDVYMKEVLNLDE